MCAGAVSYTHLDVYKRQIIYRAKDVATRGEGSKDQFLIDLLPAVCRQRLYEGNILQQMLGQPVPFG